MPWGNLARAVQWRTHQPAQPKIKIDKIIKQILKEEEEGVKEERSWECWQGSRVIRVPCAFLLVMVLQKARQGRVRLSIRRAPAFLWVSFASKPHHALDRAVTIHSGHLGGKSWAHQKGLVPCSVITSTSLRTGLCAVRMPGRHRHFFRERATEGTIPPPPPPPAFEKARDEWANSWSKHTQPTRPGQNNCSPNNGSWLM